MLYLATPSNGPQQVKCTVIDGQPVICSSERQPFWSDYLISDTKYARQNGIVLHRPLAISAIDQSSDYITVKLQNWSKQKTFAVVTTSTFMPTSQESLMNVLLGSRSLSRPVASDNSTDSTHSVFFK